MRDHPGQIGLPGGGVHPDDRDLQATALRELHEEVGIGPERATILAQLPTRQQRRVNNFDVTPFVAVVEAGELVVDAAESVGAFVVPLAAVLDGGLREGSVEVAGMRVPSLVLDYEGHRIWGLTAHILHSFVDQWKRRGLRARVAPYLTGSC